MMEISGYPYSTALKIGSWTTDERPDNPQDGMFGYNTTTGGMEYYSDGQWKPLVNLPDVYDKARKDQYGNVIDLTYATKDELSNATAVMVGATASANGKKGLVPQPNKGQQNSFLRGDGTWASPESITYGEGTKAELDAGTNTTAKLWSAKILSDFVGDALADIIMSDGTSDSGYVQLPNGLILEWGTIPTQTGTSSSYKTYSFHKPFSSKTFLVVVTGIEKTSAVGSATRQEIAFGRNTTKTSFRYYPSGYQGPGDNQPYYYDYEGYWFAIGI